VTPADPPAAPPGPSAAPPRLDRASPTLDPALDRTLAARALAAQHRAYAPYSKFRVGATIQMSGQLFDGVNVENASYGLANCAERTAVFAAVVAGAHRLEAVTVCTDASPPSSPCGACRQVLFEFAPDPAAVVVTAINPAGERRSWTLAALLPDGFSGRELP
jgi:cytidine deaminase